MLLTPVSESTPEFYQSELMEKFNLAFYEAQSISKSDNFTLPTSSFNEDTNADDYLIDYLISEDSQTSPQDIDFDFNDFVEDFDQNVRDSFSDSTTVTDFDTETFTTSSECQSVHEFSNFFVTPPISSKDDFEDIEGLSDGSLDISDWTTFDQTLPPVATITKTNFDFNCYVRNVPENDMGYLKNDSDNKSEFGHLLGEVINPQDLEVNHMVLPQSDALLNDDPLLSSSSNFYTNHRTPSEDNRAGFKDEEGPNEYQCKWQQCYHKCYSQDSLVGHIEKFHVEVKRGDEFTCYWEQCPRKTKPFNARYKLLIHMRVHSGEKPNKCPFKGCHKAFSRLENLKIHQRSHTGERPYLCQFSGCMKCFSNSSDRAKHQRTHFDTKPYACQVQGCFKKYTDPSSLRKHVKNHTHEEQMQIKKKSQEDVIISNAAVRKFLDPSRQKAIKIEPVYTNSPDDHTYSTMNVTTYVSVNVKQDLKNKIEMNKIRKGR